MKKTPKQIRIEEKSKNKEIQRRFFKRNIEAQRFCNKQGLTIYVAAQSQASNLVKIFVQKGVPFKPLNGILYDQDEPKDVMSYTAAIDAEYERLYLKMKDKV